MLSLTLEEGGQDVTDVDEAGDVLDAVVGLGGVAVLDVVGGHGDNGGRQDAVRGQDLRAGEGFV